MHCHAADSSVNAETESARGEKDADSPSWLVFIIRKDMRLFRKRTLPPASLKYATGRQGARVDIPRIVLLIVISLPFVVTTDRRSTPSTSYQRRQRACSPKKSIDDARARAGVRERDPLDHCHIVHRLNRTGLRRAVRRGGGADKKGSGSSIGAGGGLAGGWHERGSGNRRSFHRKPRFATAD